MLLGAAGRLRLGFSSNQDGLFYLFFASYGRCQLRPEIRGKPGTRRLAHQTSKNRSLMRQPGVLPFSPYWICFSSSYGSAPILKLDGTSS